MPATWLALDRKVMTKRFKAACAPNRVVYDLATFFRGGISLAPGCRIILAAIPGSQKQQPFRHGSHRLTLCFGKDSPPPESSFIGGERAPDRLCPGIKCYHRDPEKNLGRPVDYVRQSRGPP